MLTVDAQSVTATKGQGVLWKGYQTTANPSLTGTALPLYIYHIEQSSWQVVTPDQTKHSCEYRRQWENDFFSFCEWFSFSVSFIFSTVGPDLYRMLLTRCLDFVSFVYVCTRLSLASLYLYFILILYWGVCLTVFVLIWQYKQYNGVSYHHTNHNLIAG